MSISRNNLLKLFFFCVHVILFCVSFPWVPVCAFMCVCVCLSFSPAPRRVSGPRWLRRERRCDRREEMKAISKALGAPLDGPAEGPAMTPPAFRCMWTHFMLPLGDGTVSGLHKAHPSLPHAMRHGL